MKNIMIIAAVTALSLPALTACSTASMKNNDPAVLRVGDIHFPTRLVDNLDDAMLKTVRGDLVQMDNCLYLTNIAGQSETRRFAVTWPSNAVVEREQIRGRATKLEVVSRAAEFNDNTRSVVTIPSRVEVLAQLVNEPFNGRSSRLKKLERVRL